MTDSDSLFARFGQELPAGEILFREGEQGRHMYVLQSGSIRITKNTSDGVKTLATLGPGEFFGEMAILLGKPRSATAEVVENARLLQLDANTFEAMLTRNTEIAVRMIHKMARRLAEADAMIEVLTHRDAKTRVIVALLRQADSHGTRIPGGGIQVPITREELAARLGVDPADVDEVVTRLGRLRIAEDTPQGFVIWNLDRLSEFLEFTESKQRAGNG